MQDDKISKPEDQIIRNWIKQNYGVKVPQYGLWQMTIGEAVQYLRSLSPSLIGITKRDVETAARRKQRI